MGTGELVTQVKDNLGYRVRSAREMLMGITGDSSMSPVQRRREIRNRRLSLVGMESSEENADVAKHTNGHSEDNESSSGQIGTTTTTHGGSGGGSTASSIPSMSEVDRGTKSRVDDSGFSDVN